MLLFAGGAILLARVVQLVDHRDRRYRPARHLRVIYKTGFVSRKTTEMHMDKVEGVDVEQSILARILDYGDVVVRGAGVDLEPIRTVSAPLELRNHITGI